MNNYFMVHKYRQKIAGCAEMVRWGIGGSQYDSLLTKHLHIGNEHCVLIMAMHISKEQNGILIKH